MQTPLPLALAGLIALLPGSAPADAPRPAAQRVYLANDDHTDFMWSADADTYQRLFVEQFDFNLALIAQTRNNSPPYRHRFNTDGSYWLWSYAQLKSPAEFDRLMARVKDGSITVPLNTLVSTYGGQPLEAVLRGLLYAGRLERRYGLRFQIANATENQTLPRGLASLFAGSGAHYTFRGVCACASHIPTAVLKERPSEVYWAVGPDGQRQLMKWYSVGPHNVGTYWEAGEPEAALRWVQTDPGFRRRHVDPASGLPYRVIGLFGFGGDDLARKTGVAPPPEIPAVPGLQKVPSSPLVPHFHTLAQQHSTAARQVIVSNEIDYFRDFEATHGATLPRRSVTFGNEWDLYPASMAETTARVKRAVEKLRSAELLAVLVSQHYPAFMNNHRAARDSAFTDLGLYWEHNWTADGPVTRGQRAAWQNKLAANIEYYVDSIYAEGLIRLGGMIPRPEVNGQRPNRFFVLNPLGWARTDVADHFHTGSHAVQVIDLSTGGPTPHQIVQLDGATHIRLLAREVPAAGYKVFEIRPSSGAPGPAAATAEPAAPNGSRVFENSALRLVVARDGAITSLIDKRPGGSELAALRDGLALNDIAPGSDEGEPLRLENAGPVSVTLLARSDAGLPHRSRITLYAHSERIDIRNQIDSNFGDVRHWAFNLDLPHPRVHTEEVGAINLNRREAEGGHYADSHARYDHVTVNHFADISAGDGSRGVTLSNPDLSFARLGRSRPDQLDTSTPALHLLAGGQVDGTALGIPRQNGATHFLQRFALRAHRGYRATEAMRFALEHQNPLIAAPVLGRPTGPYPAERFQLLAMDDPAVMLWAVKPPEDGDPQDLILRLWHLGDAPAQATLQAPAGLPRATLTTHIETPLRALPASADGRLRTEMQPQQLQTLRLSRAASPPP